VQGNCQNNFEVDVSVCVFVYAKAEIPGPQWEHKTEQTSFMVALLFFCSSNWS